MRKKIILSLVIIALLTFLTFGFFVGCAQVEGNAVLYDNAGEWMCEEFLDENMTKGARFDSDRFGESFDAETLPQEITHIVTDNTKFEEIFAEFPPGVDFESEMLVIYITTNTYMGDSYKLKKAISNGGILEVEMRWQSSVLIGCTGSEPQQRCFVIKMDREEITEVKVEYA